MWPRVVSEFLTAEDSRPIEIHRHLRSVYGVDVIDVSSDVGSIVIRVVKRALVKCPAAADQPRQRQRRSKTRLKR